MPTKTKEQHWLGYLLNAALRSASERYFLFTFNELLTSSVTWYTTKIKVQNTMASRNMRGVSLDNLPGKSHGPTLSFTPHSG